MLFTVVSQLVQAEGVWRYFMCLWTLSHSSLFSHSFLLSVFLPFPPLYFSFHSLLSIFPSISSPPAIISESLQPLSGVCTDVHLFWTQRQSLAGLPCQKWPPCDWLSISRYASIMNNSGVQNHVSSRICSVSVQAHHFKSHCKYLG